MGQIEKGLNYLKSLPSILKILEFVVLVISIGIVGYFLDKTDAVIESILSNKKKGNLQFFIAVVVVACIVVVALFSLFITGLHEKVTQINWPLTVAIISIVFSALLLVSSALIADSAKYYETKKVGNPFSICKLLDNIDADVQCSHLIAGTILIKLFAAGVNPVDTYIRSGTYARKPSLPYIPGDDGAGVIKSVGQGVTGFKEGDRVYASEFGTGTYAQFTVCNEENVHQLHPCLTFKQGAALGVPYLTAYRALFHKLKIKQKDTLFVHGASGGVGMAAVQLAKAHGVHVLGSAGSDDGCEVVKQAGAHQVFNHKEEGYLEKVMAATEHRGADAILENLANVNLASDLSLVADYGRIAVVGNRGTIEINPRMMMVKESSIMGVLLFKSSKSEKQEAAMNFYNWAEKGWLRPIVGKTFKLMEAPKAHKEILESCAKGKLVLEID